VIVMSSSARGRARPDSIAEPDVLDNLASFTPPLRAENKAPSTIVAYSRAVEQFEAFLADGRRRRPRRVADVRREDVEAFLVERGGGPRRLRCRHPCMSEARCRTCRVLWAAR
jgi:integrase family protein with SAM-like domain